MNLLSVAFLEDPIDVAGDVVHDLERNETAGCQLGIICGCLVQQLVL